MKTEMPELKPCGWCQSPAYTMETSSRVLYGCSNPKCPLHFAWLTSEYWNTRAKNPIIEALEKRVKELERDKQYWLEQHDLQNRTRLKEINEHQAQLARLKKAPEGMKLAEEYDREGLAYAHTAKMIQDDAIAATRAECEKEIEEVQIKCAEWQHKAQMQEQELTELRKDKERLMLVLDNFLAEGRPHASNRTYPDGCECDLCQNWDTLNKERLAINAAMKK